MKDTMFFNSFVQQLGIAFFFELILGLRTWKGETLVAAYLRASCFRISFVWPLELLKFCLERSGCGLSLVGAIFLSVVCVLGVVNAYIAIAVAYTPACIVLVGHHPLLLGLVNFLLDIPYKLLENQIKKFFWRRVCPVCGEDGKPSKLVFSAS